MFNVSSLISRLMSRYSPILKMALSVGISCLSWWTASATPRWKIGESPTLFSTPIKTLCSSFFSISLVFFKRIGIVSIRMRITLASFKNTLPAGVRRTLRLSLWRSTMPSSLSRSAICLLRADWDIKSVSAALLKLSVSATAAKYFNCLISICVSRLSVKPTITEKSFFWVSS